MSEELPLVSIVAPAYEEAAIIESNLARLLEYLETLTKDHRFELIVVDDGSTDGTGELARAFAASHENVRVHHHARNEGLGRALRSGFARARGQTIVVIDIDLSYAPEHIGVLLECIGATRADVVVASPYMAGGRASDVPLLRRILSRTANRFLALTARGANQAGNLSTLTGMVRAYDADFIRSLNLTSTGMEINTEIIYKALILGARIEEVPAHIDWSLQRKTRSARTSGKRIRRGIRFSLFAGYTIRPFAFFIIPASVLALASLYPMYWVFYHVIDHYQEASRAHPQIGFAVSEAVARAFQTSPHAFIVGGIAVVLSVQLFSLGILALQLKHNFEELFHLGTRVYSHSRDLERLLDERITAPSPTRSEMP